MIVLDTNVLSEPIKPRPCLSVLTWIANQTTDLAVTSVTVGELLYGVEVLPSGQRGRALRQMVEDVLTRPGRVLDYDQTAARIFAELRARAKHRGQTLAVEDGMIAAICLANGASLATRNTNDFAGLGLQLHDPWSEATQSP